MLGNCSQRTGKFGKLYLFYNLSSVDIAAGYSPSVLNEMRTALHASQALRLNLTMNLPADYTPLTLAEGFYMATMGGAVGIYTCIYNFLPKKMFTHSIIKS